MSLVNDTNKDNLKLYPGYYVIMLLCYI